MFKAALADDPGNVAFRNALATESINLAATCLEAGDAGQALAIQRAIRLQHLGAEVLDDRRQGRRFIEHRGMAYARDLEIGRAHV